MFSGQRCFEKWCSALAVHTARIFRVRNFADVVEPSLLGLTARLFPAALSATLLSSPERPFVLCRWRCANDPRGSSRLAQQIRCFETEFPSQPIDDVDACCINASFDRADVGAIDFRPMGELLLRQVLRLPKLPQVERQNLPNVHERERNGLSSILPRSILYKLSARGLNSHVLSAASAAIRLESPPPRRHNRNLLQGSTAGRISGPRFWQRVDAFAPHLLTSGKISV